MSRRDPRKPIGAAALVLSLAVVVALALMVREHVGEAPPEPQAGEMARGLALGARGETTQTRVVSPTDAHATEEARRVQPLVNVVLPDRLVGRVVRLVDSQALWGAVVSLHAGAEARAAELAAVTVDDDGYFAFDVPKQTDEHAVLHVGATVIRGRRVKRDVALREYLDSGSPLIVVDTGWTLHATITWSDGTPARGAYVNTREPDRNRMFGYLDDYVELKDFPRELTRLRIFARYRGLTETCESHEQVIDVPADARIVTVTLVLPCPESRVR